jgi:cupin-like protein
MTGEAHSVTWPSWFRPLPRVDRPDRAARARVFAGTTPTLFSGAIAAWPALTRWTPDQLSAAFGALEIEALIDLPARGVLYPRPQDDYLRKMRFAEFAAHMVQTPASRPCYLAYARLDELLAERRADFDFAGLTDDHGASDTRLWIGSGGTRSLLHSDLKQNLFAQIWGRKAAILVPFADSRAVYPCLDNIVNSAIDPDELDLVRFPRFRKAPVYCAVVEPGDVLYIPRGCWHHFRSLEPSISLNHWWGPPLDHRDYLRMLVGLGPRYWLATARDFVVHGVLGRADPSRFFFSPPSTGRRLFDLLTVRDFSRSNDPIRDAQRTAAKEPA